MERELAKDRHVSYYNNKDKWPEGLYVVAERHEGGYDWSIITVFQHEDNFYWLADGGCSCFGPYDDGMYTLDDLNKFVWGDFEAAVKDDYYLSDADRTQFLAEVSAIVGRDS